MRAADLILAAASTASSTSGFYDGGLGRFLLSPGFGGVAVLIGGALAYVAARRQSGDTRAKAADERTKASQERADALARETESREVVRQERWWATLTWVYDRATAEHPGVRLTADLAQSLFDKLLDQAHTEVEIEVVIGLFDLFEDRTEGSER